MKEVPQAVVAYFSMEIGLGNGMPTYSGGLGVLSGDTLKAAADMRVPMVAVSLRHEHGFMKQVLSEDGMQREEPQEWDVAAFCERVPHTVQVTIDGRAVHVTAWKLLLTGVYQAQIPIYFLDTNLPENDDRDKGLTASLYGGDRAYRLRQEMVLGIGGVRMLDSLGVDVEKYHMNEGHSAFLTMELLKQAHKKTNVYPVEEIRDRCVFTTHTPVAAGHDRFSRDEVAAAWRDAPLDAPHVITGNNEVSMTHLALHYSSYVNGVAKKHGEVSRDLFPGYCIDSITNGVHSATWVSPELQAVFDDHMPGWRADSSMLRYAVSIPVAVIAQAHAKAKERLFTRITESTGVTLNPKLFTIGFARRATAYKRAELLFTDIKKLQKIAQTHGGLQLVFAGKAHPNDGYGKEIIKRIYSRRLSLGTGVSLVFIPNYGMDVAKDLVSGVDVWLNTPQRPLEASGTSGMKAAHNGVPSLSVLDGWWIEGCMEGLTGWSIGPLTNPEGISEDECNVRDAQDLYTKLDQSILPLYYDHPDRWAEVMRWSIALNGSFFNTHRMIQEYVLRAYFSS